jgi:hypothetical protein
MKLSEQEKIAFVLLNIKNFDPKKRLAKKTEALERCFRRCPG